MPQVEKIVRPTATKQKGASTRAAAFKVELPFIMRAILTGTGPFKTRFVRLAMRQESPLFVKGLLVEARDGTRACLMGADLHGGSRWLTERIARLTHSEGLHTGNIFLSASHNHSGFGGLYASPYYDGYASGTSLVRSISDCGRIAFNRKLMEWIADEVAKAIKGVTWRDAFVAPGVALVKTPHAVNRSVLAFMRNFSDSEPAARAELARRFPCDANAPIERVAVDPRVSSVVAFTNDEAGEMIGAFTTYGAHNFVLDRQHDVQSPDYFGHAARAVEERLQLHQTIEPIVALVAGSVGDCDPLPPQFHTLSAFVQARSVSSEELNLEAVKRHAAAMVAPMLESIAQAKVVGPHALNSITAGFLEETIASAQVPSGKLPAIPCVGTPTLAGSELGIGNPLFDEGKTSGHSLQGHSPKNTFNLVVAVPNGALARQPKTLPVRLFRFNFEQCPALNLLGLPGEPTLWTAITLAEFARKSDAECSFVAGVTGDYSGYLTTEKEYGAQHYEGSSTIWGPLTHEWLHEQVKKLKAGEGNLPPTGEAHFPGDEEVWFTNVHLVDGKYIGFWAKFVMSMEEVREAHEGASL